MPTDIALDATARTFDKDGRMHISRSHISKANICPYYGREIPGYEALGLDADKQYQLLRSPEELEKAAPTFARLPILSKHIPVSAEAPRQDLIIGTIGTDVQFLDPYLDADLSFWESEAIAGIETDAVRELSCAYHYVPVMAPGVYKGQKYDGIMTQIQGNHLALVESGRAGSDVLAADSTPRELMKMTKLGKALTVALGTAFPGMALDALSALVGGVTKKTFDRSSVRPQLLAMDAKADSEKVDAVMDAIVDVDDEPEAKKPAKDKKTAKDKAAKDSEEDEPAEDEEEDEEEEERKKKTAKDKAAKDKAAKDAKEDDDKDEKVKHAMDSFKRELRESNEARIAVRSIVGDVIAQDSASDIYGFALDTMKIDHKGVEGVPSLRALFTLANTKSAPVARIAQDAAGVTAKFPNANRFRQA